MGGAAVKVIHRHRIGRREFTRVSDLTYVAGQPMAVLSWLRHGEGRAPAVCVPLDASQLKAGARRRMWLYAGVTVDPRYST